MFLSTSVGGNSSPVGNSSYQVDLAYILNYVRLVHAEITRGDGNVEKGILENELKAF